MLSSILSEQNVLVDRASQTIKITDFGLARQFLPPQKPYTEKVMTMSTIEQRICVKRMMDAQPGFGHCVLVTDLIGSAGG
jgi:serine/threonine protein kinase